MDPKVVVGEAHMRVDVEQPEPDQGRTGDEPQPEELPLEPQPDQPQEPDQGTGE